MSGKEGLSKLRGSHKVYRRRMESLETEILALLCRFDIQNEEHKYELCAYKTKYQTKIEEIKTVDSKILNFLSQEEYEHELTESLIREDAFINVMTKIDRVLSKIYNLETNDSEHSFVRETTSNHTRSPSNPTETVKVKLPKLELKPFDGNVLNWQPFWDRFQSSIDSNSNISPVGKLAYLQSLVSPSASECISDLITTAEDCNEAAELLKQRYGNTQVLINAHMRQYLCQS